METQETSKPDKAGKLLYASDEKRCRGAETILLVEDETFVREVACEVLTSAGYRVVSASNSREAMGLYDAEVCNVQLLLTDIVLPGETGRVLAGRLRLRNPELNVLFVSGYAEQMGIGVEEEFLPKPFSTQALLRRVRKSLDCKSSGHGENDRFMLACENA